MKKSLVLLPLLGGFLLAGCQFTIFGKTIKLFEKDQQEEKKDGDEKGGSDVLQEDVIINHETLSDYLEADYTYPQADYEFSVGGVNFSATSGVGHKTRNQSGGNYYYDQQALQFRKQGHEKGAGVITVLQAVSASKITVHWFATYAEEASKYHPVVLVGDSQDNIKTNVSCNEGASVKGVKAGAKEGDYDAYNYTTTYNLSGKKFFAISAPAGALYVKDIVINK